MGNDKKSSLIARNRSKKQHKVYLCEAEIDMIKDLSCGTVSKTIHAIVAAFLSRIGNDMSFLKRCDHIQINNIRRAITPYG